MKAAFSELSGDCNKLRYHAQFVALQLIVLAAMALNRVSYDRILASMQVSSSFVSWKYDACN
jgi:hypothetical protein